MELGAVKIIVNIVFHQLIFYHHLSQSREVNKLPLPLTLPLSLALSTSELLAGHSKADQLLERHSSPTATE